MNLTFANLRALVNELRKLNATAERIAAAQESIAYVMREQAGLAGVVDRSHIKTPLKDLTEESDVVYTDSEAQEIAELRRRYETNPFISRELAEYDDDTLAAIMKDPSAAEDSTDSLDIPPPPDHS